MNLWAAWIIGLAVMALFWTFVLAYIDDQKRKANPKTRDVRVGKGTVVLKMQDGTVYKREITGFADGWGYDDIYSMQVADIYRGAFLDSDSQFLTMDNDVSVPKCNVKEMTLENVDESYSVQVEV